MPAFTYDTRIAIRQLRKNVAFSITTILTLALAIGATTSIFSIVDTVLLRPLPFHEPDRLVSLQQQDRPAQASTRHAGVPESLSYPDFFDWQAQSRSFSAMASYRNVNFTLTGAGDARHLPGELVSSQFFRVLEAHPMVGRGFIESDDKPGVRTVVLSNELWRSQFGGATEVVGKTLTLDGEPYTVVGVMPPGFVFPIRTPAAELWTNLGEDAAGERPAVTRRGMDILDVVARLKPGVSVKEATSELDVIVNRLSTAYPGTNRSHALAMVQPEMEHIVGDVKPALRVLFAAVALLLIIACANVAGLYVARASRRESEMALRTFLGASRGQIIKQVLIESVIVAIGAGVLSILFTSTIVHGLVRLAPKNLPRLTEASVDSHVIVFGVLLSILTGLFFGVLPALRMSQTNPQMALRQGSRSVAGGGRQRRVLSLLIVAETAIGMVLLVISGLLMRSFVEVLRVDPGFDPGHVLTARIDLPDNRYTTRQQSQFYDRLLSKLSVLPGVTAVSAGWPLPLSASSAIVSFTIEGRASSNELAEPLNVVTADYFKTLRIPIRAGRSFTARDDASSAPVIVINEEFAKRYFPGRNPLGNRITVHAGDDVVKQPPREIIGVIGNMRRTGLTAAIEAQYYLPFSQAVLVSPPICIRTAGDPSTLARPLRDEVAGIDRDIPVFQVGTLEDFVWQSAAQPRFHAVLLSCFAALALLLSALGLYAVLSYTVAQRSKELGVRLALGARPESLLWMILRHGLRFAVTGLLIGAAISAMATRVIAGMLYKVRPFDPLTLAAVGLILLTVALIACSGPAIRAARLDPMNTLRDS